MTTLAAEITRRTYAVEVPDDLFRVLTEVEYRLPFMGTLLERMDRLPGITVHDYNGHLGAAVHFSADADDGDVTSAVQAIEDHLELCVASEALLPNFEAERLKAMRGDPGANHHAAETDLQSVRPLFAGPGFLFCDRRRLGLALHFRCDGEDCTKWFVDGAADQWRDLLSGLPVRRAGRDYKEALIQHAASLLPDGYEAADWIDWDDIRHTMKHGVPAPA